jgi:hypothetical protein
MDITANKSNPDNVSRPRGGIPLDNLPFQTKQLSKTEIFGILSQSIEENQPIDGKTMERFSNAITDKSTTAKELNRADDILRQLAARPTVLSEEGQSLFMDAIPSVANHRNADYSMAGKGKEILSETSKHLPQLAEEAQGKFFNTVAALSPGNRDMEWKSEILVNIANASENGLDDIGRTASDQYVNTFGNVAQNIHSLPPEAQAQTQQAGIELIQKMQYPYHFNADSFREALFAVPEDVRTPDYRIKLAELDKNLARSADEDTAKKTSSAIEKPIIHEEYVSPEVAEVPVEILPQALPIAPDSPRTIKDDEPNGQEELEENFAAAQAE